MIRGRCWRGQPNPAAVRRADAANSDMAIRGLPTPCGAPIGQSGRMPTACSRTRDAHRPLLHCWHALVLVALGSMACPWPGTAVAASGERMLHRCLGADGVPRWQDSACREGEAGRAITVPAQVERPRRAARSAPSARPARAGRETVARPTRSARPPARVERALAACQAAKARARERSDASGRRLPVREIRARERAVADACA